MTIWSLSYKNNYFFLTGFTAYSFLCYHDDRVQRGDDVTMIRKERTDFLLVVRSKFGTALLN